MALQFKIGDFVRLSSIARKRYIDSPSNPHNGLGKVRWTYPGEGFCYSVSWIRSEDYNHGNSYQSDDLVFAVNEEKQLEDYL